MGIGCGRLCGWRIRLHQDLCYPWSLLLPFNLLHDSLHLTLACEVHRRLKELQDSSLWDLPWLSTWARRVAWQVHCSYWLLQHFSHETIRDCAARMGLKVDFKWFLCQTPKVLRTPVLLSCANWLFFQLMFCFDSNWYGDTVFSWVCCRPCGPKVIPSSFFLTMSPSPVLLV